MRETNNKEQKPSQHMSKMLSFPKPSVPKKSGESIITLLTDFIANANGVGLATSRLAQTVGNSSAALGGASSGFEFGDLGLAIIDFFRIPGIYLRTYLSGEKPPITLSKNARWLYSGALLGLTISSLAVPAAAPPIAFALSGLTLSFSLSTMAKTLYNLYKTPMELEILKDTIAMETEELNQLHLETLELEKQLNESNDTEKKNTLDQEIKAKTIAFDALFKKREEHYLKEYRYEAKIDKHNTKTVMNKGVAIALASLALAGLTLSLFFPPLGAALMTASAILGASYFVASVTYPPIKNWVTKLFSKHNAPVNTEAPHEQQEVSIDNTITLSHSADSIEPPTTLPESLPPLAIEPEPAVHESTAMLMQKLYGTQGAAKALDEQITESILMENIQHTLRRTIEKHDLVGILAFFSQALSHINIDHSKITTDNLTQFFNNFDELQPSLDLLRSAISEVKKGNINVSDQDITKLLACQPLVEFLLSERIDIRTLASDKVQVQKSPTAKSTSKITLEDLQQH